MFLSFTRFQLKKILPFIVILFIMMFFLFVYNMYFKWEGVLLIVKTYIYAISFFYIYNIASDNPEKIYNSYIEKKGIAGEFIYLFESRLLPFILLFFMIAILNLILSYGNDNWISNGILVIIDGKNTNILVFSALLLIILKLKKRPLFSISIFFMSALIYNYLNNYFYNNFYAGISILYYKTAKIGLFLFLILCDFKFTSKKTAFSLIMSTVTAFIIGFSILKYYQIQFSSNKPSSKNKTEAAFMIAKYGNPAPLEYLKENSIKTKNAYTMIKVIKMYEYYKKQLDIPVSTWELFITENQMKEAELISAQLVKEGIFLDDKVMIQKALSASSGNDLYLLKSINFTRLAAHSIQGKESDFQKMIDSSGTLFTKWGLMVLGETDSCKSIIFLSKFLTDVDQEISSIAYDSLKSITGIHPVKDKGLLPNSPETIRDFKNFYLSKCTGN